MTKGSRAADRPGSGLADHRGQFFETIVQNLRKGNGKLGVKPPASALIAISGPQK